MIPVWMEEILAVAKKKVPLSFRAEPRHADWFICIAEWKEDGVVRVERALRFQCDSDRKADFFAEQLMREQIARYLNQHG